MRVPLNSAGRAYLKKFQTMLVTLVVREKNQIISTKKLTFTSRRTH